MDVHVVGDLAMSPAVEDETEDVKAGGSVGKAEFEVDEVDQDVEGPWMETDSIVVEFKRFHRVILLQMVVRV